MNDGKQLTMWTIYDNPKEFPGQTIARLWYALPKHGPTDQVIVAELDDLRARFASEGLVNIGRSPNDDTAIVEVWM